MRHVICLSLASADGNLYAQRSVIAPQVLFNFLKSNNTTTTQSVEAVDFRDVVLHLWSAVVVLARRCVLAFNEAWGTLLTLEASVCAEIPEKPTARRFLY